MTNGRWLLNTAIYDVLVGMQKVVDDYHRTGNQFYCILDALPNPPGNCDKSCEDCIQKWLNKEADG